MDSPKEMILAAIRGEAPARTPVALMGGGVWWARRRGLSLKPLAASGRVMAENLVEMAAVTGSDIIYVGSGYPNALAAALGGGMVFNDIGAPELAHPFVFNETDVARLDITQSGNSGLLNVVKEALAITRGKIGDERLVTMTAWGPFTLAGRVMGEERWLKCLYKNPAMAHRLLDVLTEAVIHLYKPVLSAGLLEVVMLGEPSASGDLISKKHFDEFAVPYLARFAEWASREGAYTMVHVCGNTSDRLELFLKTGCVIVSLDSKAPLEKMRETLGPSVCFAGNIDPIKTLLHGSPEDVRLACQGALRAAGGNPRHILMPGCDMPPGVPLENIKAFMEAGKDWERTD